MVKINCDTRFFSINTKVILTQTDTTVGFVSQNEIRLSHIKERLSSKPFIKVYQNFHALKEDKRRVPNSQKRRVRRSKKTTFIVNQLAFRVANITLDSALIRANKWNYSTSANESSKSFNRTFCEEKTDIIVENKISLYEGNSSSLYKINDKCLRKLR